MNLSIIPIKSTGAGVMAAFAALLCCVTPVLAFLVGASGIAATFSWIEPFRPFLVALTVAFFGFAWIQKLKSSKSQTGCNCDPSFWQTKKFLGIITVLAGLMLAFPNYAYVFYSDSGNQNHTTVSEADSTKKVVIDVKGMTCASCEIHVEIAVSSLKGVKNVKASYASGTATVDFLPNEIQVDQIVAAINQTGYHVVKDNDATTIQINQK
jgi:copper chaperone CopZ